MCVQDVSVCVQMAFRVHVHTFAKFCLPLQKI